MPIGLNYTRRSTDRSDSAMRLRRVLQNWIRAAIVVFVIFIGVFATIRLYATICSNRERQSLVRLTQSISVQDNTTISLTSTKLPIKDPPPKFVRVSGFTMRNPLSEAWINFASKPCTSYATVGGMATPTDSLDKVGDRIGILGKSIMPDGAVVIFEGVIVAGNLDLFAWRLPSSSSIISIYSWASIDIVGKEIAIKHLVNCEELGPIVEANVDGRSTYFSMQLRGERLVVNYLARDISGRFAILREE